ncbi:MAG: hypothetical protein WCI27_05025 [Candidatus Omnitrophota bacterium]
MSDGGKITSRLGDAGFMREKALLYVVVILSGLALFFGVGYYCFHDVKISLIMTLGLVLLSAGILWSSKIPSKEELFKTRFRLLLPYNVYRYPSGQSTCEMFVYRGRRLSFKFFDGYSVEIKVQCGAMLCRIDFISRIKYLFQGHFVFNDSISIHKDFSFVRLTEERVRLWLDEVVVIANKYSLPE